MQLANIVVGGSVVEEGCGTGSGPERSSGGKSRRNDGGMSDTEMERVDDAREMREKEEASVIIVIEDNGASGSGHGGGSLALVARISSWSWTS